MNAPAEARRFVARLADGRPPREHVRWTLRETIGLSLAALSLLALGYWLGGQLAQWTRLPQRDEIARRLLDEGNALEAAQLFSTASWRGVALYRAGRYQRAAEAFALGDDADAAFNRGNALLRLGRYDDARKAYRLALARDPSHTDAQTNLDLLDQLDERKRDQAPGETGAAPQLEPRADPGADDKGGDQSSQRPPGIEQRSRENPPEDADAEPVDEPKTPQTQAASTGPSSRPGEAPETRHDDALAAPARSDDRERERRDGDTDGTGSQDSDALPATASEQALAENIALRHLVDDPALVLRARLSAAAQARRQP